jgi:hypothetical protein
MADDAWDRDRHFLANAQVQCFAEERMTHSNELQTFTSKFDGNILGSPSEVNASSYHLQ